MEAADITEGPQILEGLVYIHKDLNIFYGNLKRSDVIITNEGDVKIGMSKTFARSHDCYSSEKILLVAHSDYSLRTLWEFPQQQQLKLYFRPTCLKSLAGLLTTLVNIYTAKNVALTIIFKLVKLERLRLEHDREMKAGFCQATLSSSDGFLRAKILISVAAPNRFFSSKIATCLVGSDGTSFHVHVKALNKFLKPQLIDDSRAETKEVTLDFQDMDEITFMHCCEFAYTGDYSVIPAPKLNLEGPRTVMPSAQRILRSLRRRKEICNTALSPFPVFKLGTRYMVP
ncbi:hypothetical protein AJ80_08084 [Polytolypa hystricis UAMH7299]|uniref:BTB domain-containing protein n=1 Tax=Polytolypa hystricis (strain UAMH7299) TaxID=1447883 RepID=A0A2B7XDZ0_POLH7|nr:hypothetical protein AJ80_08084 [Polytolypa hystricis UAMH7299]